METLGEVAKGLAESPLSWMCALLVGAVAYLWKQVRESEKAHTDTLRAHASEQKEILTEVLPLAEKLADAVEALERVSLSLRKE